MQFLLAVCNDGRLLVFEEYVHLFPLLLMGCLELSLLSAVLLDQHFDLILELIDKVAALRLQHIDLLFQISDMSLIALFSSPSFRNFIIFLLLNLLNCGLQLEDSLGQLSDLVVQLPDLLVHVSVCRL